MTKRYFGTDGIRGKVGDKQINPQFFLQLGWAVGKILANHSKSGANDLVLIGKDTRISGYMFESALEAGLISAGVGVGLLGPMPTPAIAYLTRTFQAKAGIVISASHNPYTDNGIKLFNTLGGKLADELEYAIEEQLDQPLVMAPKLGKARRISDAEGRYVEFCKASLPWGFSLSGLRIALDCANGATYSIAPKVFSELGATVDVIGASPDGENINLRCGSTSLDALSARVKDIKADMGIAFDGDGDRVLFVDANGRVVDGDQLLFIIAMHRKQSAGCDGVAGTLMTNFGFERAMRDAKIPFGRANVGDRYVLELMEREGWRLGGESSGHIICKDVTTTGDGIVSALQVVRALVDQGLGLREAAAAMPLLPQIMINVPLSKKVDPLSNATVRQACAHTEEKMRGRGRVLLRSSGTEPLIRVMVEGEDEVEVGVLCAELAAVVERELS